MLVLTRKQQQSVVVGGEDGIHQLLKVTVLDITNGSVKLGFEVNADVPVHRLEVWERIRAENGQRFQPAIRRTTKDQRGPPAGDRSAP